MDKTSIKQLKAHLWRAQIQCTTFKKGRRELEAGTVSSRFQSSRGCCGPRQVVARVKTVLIFRDVEFGCEEEMREDKPSSLLGVGYKEVSLEA